MPTRTVGGIRLKLEGDEKDLIQSIQKANTSLRKHRASIKSTQTRYQALSTTSAGLATRTKALIGVLGVGLGGAYIKGLADTATELQKIAVRSEISVESLQKLGRLYEGEGGSIEGFADAYLRLTNSIAEANEGLSTQVRAFETLNIDPNDLIPLEAEERFLAVARAVNQLEDDTLKVSVAQDLFGRRHAALLNVIAQGEEGIREASAEVERFGLVSTDQARNAEELTQSFTNLRQSVDVFFIRLLSGSTDAKGAAEAVNDFASALQDFGDVVDYVIPALLTLALIFGGLPTKIAAAVIGFARYSDDFREFIRSIDFPALREVLTGSSEFVSAADTLGIAVDEQGRALRDAEGNLIKLGQELDSLIESEDGLTSAIMEANKPLEEQIGIWEKLSINIKEWDKAYDEALQDNRRFRVPGILVSADTQLGDAGLTAPPPERGQLEPNEFAAQVDQTLDEINRMYMESQQLTQEWEMFVERSFVRVADSLGRFVEEWIQGLSLIHI